MLKQSTERARDDLRIQDRKIQRELANEDSTDGAEQFVTEAYKQHRKLLHELEVKEKLQEQLEYEKRQKQGEHASTIHFYSNLLNARTSRTESIQKLMLEPDNNTTFSPRSTSSTKVATLSAGLNQLKPPPSTKQAFSKITADIEAQLLQIEERECDAKKAELEKLDESFKRKVTDDQVNEARKRYEERKKLKK